MSVSEAVLLIPLKSCITSATQVWWAGYDCANIWMVVSNRVVSPSPT
jgi:hypothetical protein